MLFFGEQVLIEIISFMMYIMFYSSTILKIQ